MSKASRKAAHKRRKHNQKKYKTDETIHVAVCNRKTLIVVGYMSNDFLKVLCVRSGDKNEIVVKFKAMHSILCTRISLYTLLTDIPDMHKLLNDLTLDNGHYFQSMTNRESTVEICDDNLCVVGRVTHEEVDQFRGDLKFSDSGNNVEVVVHQLLDNHQYLIIEIYADNVNREFVLALLEDGWMSDRWKNKFFHVN